MSKKKNKKSAPRKRHSSGNKKSGDFMGSLMSALKDPKVLMGVAAGVAIPWAVEKFGKDAIKNEMARNAVKAIAPAALIALTVKDQKAIVSAAAGGVAMGLGGMITTALDSATNKTAGMLFGSPVFSQTEGNAQLPGVPFPPSQIQDAEYADVEGIEDDTVNGEEDDDVNGDFYPKEAPDGLGGFIEGADIDRVRD